jgi:thiamine transport system permease protein
MNKPLPVRANNFFQKFIYLMVFVALYLPVLLVLAKAFLTRNAFANLGQFVTSAVFVHTLSFSAQEAFFSAGLSLVLALPGAYFFGRYRFPGKKIMRSVMVLPFMFPGILVVLGMIIFYGNNGVFNHLLQWMPGLNWKFDHLYGFWGIVLANVIYNFTFCLRMLGESWQRIDPKLTEASKLLGAGPYYTWKRITFPLLMPTITYLFVLVFLYSFLSFTVVLVLGGYLYKTFEVLIYIEYNQKLNFNQATVIATVQTLILAFFLSIQTYLSRKSGHLGDFSPDQPKLRYGRNPVLSSLFVGYLILAAFFLISPLVAVLSRSFYGGGALENTFSLKNYTMLLNDQFGFTVGRDFIIVLGTSIGIALLVALITVMTAYWFARERMRARRIHSFQNADLWLQLPLGISFLTFAFGVLMIAGRFLPSWVLVVWAQIFISFPLIYSQLKTARSELPESLLEAAATLGADSRKIFLSVEFPLMKRAIGTAFSYAMALSMGDLTAVLVLGRGELITIPVAIYRLIGHYQFTEATALGGIYIMIALLLLSLWRNR